MVKENGEEVDAVLAIVRRAMARVEAMMEPGGAAAGTTLRDMAERLYSERRLRDEHFPQPLFGEPAWDLLLALFVAREEGRELSLAEAYAAARVKPGAGRGLLRRMEKEGLVSVVGTGPRRNRRSVRLTGEAVERLAAYLSSLI